MHINSRKPEHKTSKVTEYIRNAKLKRKSQKQNIDLKKENLRLQLKITQLLRNSRLDKAEISKLKKELLDLQKQYNQLDEEQVKTSDIFSRF